MKISSVDELPKFSDWPAILLGIKPQDTIEQNPSLLEKFKQNPGSRLEDVDRWAAGDATNTLASVDQHIVEMTPEESHEAYIAFIENALVPRLPATALVEIGRGYGSVILGLARKAAFQDIPYFVADSTPTGLELAGLIAKEEGIRLTSGSAKLNSNPVIDLDIPEGALIYTAYAVHHIETLGDEFIEGIRALKPDTVVHIEPVYEHCDPSTLLGLLRQRYIEACQYNRNLSTILHHHERIGSLEIIQESRPGFGPNPLLAASVIAWKPRG